MEIKKPMTVEEARALAASLKETRQGYGARSDYYKGVAAHYTERLAHTVVAQGKKLDALGDEASALSNENKKIRKRIRETYTRAVVAERRLAELQGENHHG